MIRYPADTETIKADVRAIDPKWFDKAEKRRQKFINQGGFDEKTSIWSVIKPVFMALQNNKCVFCERQFESQEYGRIEFDLEHFRPKSSVEAWPDAQRHPKLSYSFATGARDSAGYYWLAYELGNYAASCKVCNTTFKHTFFPVAGPRGNVPMEVSALKAEKPFLCYPIGSVDDDPEDLVTFVATTAVPAARSGHNRRRGQVIIDFFGLNREALHRERARMICLFGQPLRNVAEGIGEASDLEMIAQIGASHLPHAACLRAFKRLWDTDQALARRAHSLCCRYAVSAMGTVPPEL